MKCTNVHAGLLIAIISLLLCPPPPHATAEEAFTVQQQPISFTNGPLILHGVFLSPEPATPYPTIVMVHGSGPATRDSFGGLEHYLVRSGIPVLVYDKRGVQDSMGNWKTSSLHDLTDDVLAAVAFLKKRGVARIGLWGGSQGGWIVPLAAARSTNISLIIAVASAGVSPAQQELFRQENQWRTAGLSSTQITKLRQAWRAFYNYSSTGKGAEALDREIAVLEKSKVLDDRRPLKSSELPSDAIVKHLGYSFDPLSVWQQVHCPVLAIWGEKDQLVPVSRSMDLIQHALKSAANTNCLFKIFKNARHGLTLSDKSRRFPDGTPELDWAPGYIPLLTNWIKSH